MLQKILVQLFKGCWMKKILQIQPWIDNKEASYIKKIVSKTYLTESFETKLEKDLKKFNSNYAIAISNWTNGLFISLKLSI